MAEDRGRAGLAHGRVDGVAPRRTLGSRRARPGVRRSRVGRAGHRLPVAATWSTAADFTPPLQDDRTARAVKTLVSRMEGKVPKDAPISVVHRGESWHITGPAVIYEMIEKGYDVVTKDGEFGLKWGHEHVLVGKDRTPTATRSPFTTPVGSPTPTGSA